MVTLTVVIGIITFLGMVGNITCIIVFSSSGELRKKGSNLYLLAISVANFGFILSIFLNIWLQDVGINIMGLPFACPALEATNVACFYMCAYFVLSLTIERFIVVCYPLRCPSLCRKSQSIKRIIVIGICCLLFSSYNLVMVVQDYFIDNTTNITVPACNLDDDYTTAYGIISQSEIFVGFLVPFLGVLVLNSMIIYTMTKSVQFQRECTGMGTEKLRPETDRSEPNTPSRLSLLTPRDHWQYRKSSAGSPRRSTVTGLQQKQLKAAADATNRSTMLLLAVSWSYLTFDAPIFMVRFYSLLAHTEESVVSSTFATIEIIAYVLYYSQAAVNIFIYTVAHVSFRRRLKQLLRCKYQDEKPSKSYSHPNGVNGYGGLARNSRSTVV